MSATKSSIDRFHRLRCRMAYLPKKRFRVKWRSLNVGDEALIALPYYRANQFAKDWSERLSVTFHVEKINSTTCRIWRLK